MTGTKSKAKESTSAKESASVGKSGSAAKESAPQCQLVLCEDPVTGEILAKATGPCPPGFVEKYRDRCQQDGITFIIPKVRTREE